MTYLHVPHQVHACAFDLHRQVGVHALPVRVEKGVGEAGFLVEEDHGAEVGLLV